MNIIVRIGVLSSWHINVKFIGMHVTDIGFLVHFVRPVSLDNQS